MFAQNDMEEIDNQLLARYTEGLHQNIQEALNLYDPYNVSKAHQNALQIEKQSGRRSAPSWSSTIAALLAASKNIVLAPIAPFGGSSNAKNALTFGGKCHKYGELGHNISPANVDNLIVLVKTFVETKDTNDVYDISREAIYDGNENDSLEEILHGDQGEALIVCSTPRNEDDCWLCNNIFLSTCTIGGKVWKLLLLVGAVRMCGRIGCAKALA